MVVLQPRNTDSCPYNVTNHRTNTCTNASTYSSTNSHANRNTNAGAYRRDTSPDTRTPVYSSALQLCS